MADGVSSRTAGETMSRTGVERKRRETSSHDGSEFWLALKSRGRTAFKIAVAQLVLPLGGGFLLGRAVVFGLLHPFGIAFVVALAALGQRGKSLAAALGVLLAALTSPSGSPIDSPASILVFVWLFSALVGRLFNLSPWVTASGTMVGAATLRIVSAAFAGDNVFVASVAAAVDLTAVWALLPVVRGLFGRRSQRGQVQELSRTDIAPLLIFVGLLLIGTAGLQWAGHSLHGVLTRTMLLLAALTGGVGGGAIAGASLGLLTVIGDTGALWEAVSFAVAGLGTGISAGVLSRPDRDGNLDGIRDARGEGSREGIESMYPRIGAIMGLFIAHLLLSYAAAGGEAVRFGLIHSTFAGAAVVFVPGAWIARWRIKLAERGIGVAGRRQGEAVATAWRGQLLRIAAAFDQAAATLSGEDGIAGAASESAARIALGAASARVDPGDTPPGHQGVTAQLERDILSTQDEFDAFAHDVRQTVCRGCSQETLCWETHGWQTYRDLAAFVAETEPRADQHGTPRLDARNLSSSFRRRCIKLQHFASGVEKLLALVYDRSRSEQQMQRWQAPLQRQLGELSEIIARVADEIRRMEKAKSEGGAAVREATGQYAGAAGPYAGADAPRFQLQTDSVHVPGDDSVVSGDFFQQVELPGDRVAFIVCDGMGSGARAAAESRAVVAMLHRFLEAGFDLRFCVQTINSVMLLRAAEESFITVDVSIVDLWDGTLHIAKTGAAPTFIHRGNEVEMVRADSLPVGILPAVEVFEAKSRLNWGDIVVMMSDGALELGAPRGDKGEAVRRHMQKLERPRPKQAVDSLFSRAHHSTGQQLPDDVTIVATQLFPAVIG